MASKVSVRDGPTRPAFDRLVAVVVLASALVLVWMLAGVHPDPRGFGTHEQLGMRPCGWPQTVGIPCPTCGYTTAACYLVHLSPLAALATQPCGAVVAALGLWAAGYAVYCLLTARSFLDPFVWMPYGTMLRWGLVLFLGSWLYTYLTFPR